MHPTKVAFWVGKSGTCTPKNYIFVVFKANSEGKKYAVYYAFFSRMGVQVEGA